MLITIFEAFEQSAALESHTLDHEQALQLAMQHLGSKHDSYTKYYVDKPSEDMLSPDQGVLQAVSLKHRHNYPTNIKDILKTWYVQHADFPYPTLAEKNDLSIKTQLCIKQLNTWFSNERRRHC